MGLHMACTPQSHTLNSRNLVSSHTPYFIPPSKQETSAMPHLFLPEVTVCLRWGKYGKGRQFTVMSNWKFWDALCIVLYPGPHNSACHTRCHGNLTRELDWNFKYKAYEGFECLAAFEWLLHWWTRWVEKVKALCHMKTFSSHSSHPPPCSSHPVCTDTHQMQHTHSCTHRKSLSF